MINVRFSQTKLQSAAKPIVFPQKFTNGLSNMQTAQQKMILQVTKKRRGNHFANQNNIFFAKRVFIHPIALDSNKTITYF